MDAALFPVGVWARLTRRVLSENPDAMLAGVPHEGLYELRAAISGYLRGSKGLSVPPERIIVGAGAEFLYLLLAQLFRGAAFALEDPGYPKIREVYVSSGAECLPVRLDAHGVDPASLAASGAAVLHISPAHQYPTGLVTPMPRRQALLDWAERTGGYIIEDDYDSELGFTPRPLPTLASIDRGGRVIYMNTFSQTISPGMRVGYLVLPERLLDVWRERLGFYSCAVPSLEQHVLARFISGGWYERHLARLRKTCANGARRAGGVFPQQLCLPGRHLRARCWAAFPHARRDGASRQRAAGARRGPGLRLGFLSDYSSDGSSGQHVLVINYAGLSGERLGEAVKCSSRY